MSTAPVDSAAVVQLQQQVERTTAVVDRLADEFARHVERYAGLEPVSWLALPDDPAQARQLLADLLDWLQQVYLRYTDAAPSLPDCWLWHPDIVEELLWLRAAWLAAYTGPAASITAVGDWHDRYRPGVVQRLRTVAGTCSLENHTATESAGSSRLDTAATLTDAAAAIATWWATGRTNDAAPAPTPEHHALAERSHQHRRPGHRRR